MDALPHRVRLDNAASVDAPPIVRDALATHDAALTESRDMLARTCGLGEALGPTCSPSRLHALTLACVIVQSELEAAAGAQLVRAARLAAERGHHALAAALADVARRDAGIAETLVDEAASLLRHAPHLARTDCRTVAAAASARSASDLLADDALCASSLVGLIAVRREHALAWARIDGRLAGTCTDLRIDWPTGTRLEAAALAGARALEEPLRTLLAEATSDEIIEARSSARQVHRILADALRHGVDVATSTGRSG